MNKKATLVINETVTWTIVIVFLFVMFIILAFYFRPALTQGFAKLADTIFGI